jgi:iron(III) transport system substrate-binding protein
LPKVRFSRRQLLRAATAVVGAIAAGKPGRPARAQARAVAAEPITPALIEAAKKEGKVAFYTAMDLPVAEKFAKAF